MFLYCIFSSRGKMKNISFKFPDYIDKINEKSCVISCGAIKLEDYWKNAARKLQMNVKKTEKFAYGQEGIALLKENGADAQKYNVTASPTLIMNGVKSSAIYQDTKVLEQAICSAFVDSSNVCSENNIFKP